MAEAVTGDEVMNQPHAWQIYDRWLQDDRVAGLDDPSGIELTLTRRLATKDRANCLVCALASGSQLTLVTFDGPPSGRPENFASDILTCEPHQER